MRNRKKLICLVLLAALTLSGCMRTVDQMYRVPKRSEEFTELQTAIDGAMNDLSYSAPLAGENQQAVQTADLNGDGVPEYLLFAKSDTEHPMRILIFKELSGSFELVQTLQCNGSAFDMVEYVQMDDVPGVELVFGSQLTDQLLRSASVYTFTAELEAQLLVTANYTEFLTVDLDSNAVSELFVLKPGQTETDNGIAEVYGIKNGKMERSNEMNMSGPVDRLKRILVGNIHGGIPAVYVATTVEDTALITDVYTCKDGVLSNVTFSNESGTSVKTMRNYYVYADDIDNDSVVELPYLLPMMPMEDIPTGERQQLIRWYAMTAEGKEVVKAYTYHNFLGGWYMELDSQWASRLTVVNNGNAFTFYIWDEAFENACTVMTVYVLSGQNRAAQGQTESRFVLYENDTVIYCASLESCAADYGITQQSAIGMFHLIRQDWKTGET